MQAIDIKTHYTPTEYLALEDIAEFRSEYHDGEIIPMTGGSFTHNDIITNLGLMKTKLRSLGYRFYSSDVRLWIPKYRKFTYPDVMVVQGEPVPYENRQDTLTNPRLIIEVLSKSTETYDRSDKFKFYRSLPDLQEYILINQYNLEIQQYTKADGDFWLYRAYETSAETIKLAALNIEVTVAEIYQDITFEVVS